MKTEKEITEDYGMAKRVLSRSPELEFLQGWVKALEFVLSLKED